MALISTGAAVAQDHCGSVDGNYCCSSQVTQLSDASEFLVMRYSSGKDTDYNANTCTHTPCHALASVGHEWYVLLL